VNKKVSLEDVKFIKRMRQCGMDAKRIRMPNAKTQLTLGWRPSAPRQLWTRFSRTTPTRTRTPLARKQLTRTPFAEAPLARTPFSGTPLPRTPRTHKPLTWTRLVSALRLACCEKLRAAPSGGARFPSQTGEDWETIPPPFFPQTIKIGGGAAQIFFNFGYSLGN